MQRGVDVYLVCATRGEAGETDEAHLKGVRNIAELREAELRCAAAVLGLKEVFFLGYRDSGMPGAADNEHPEAQIRHPVEEVAARVVKYIRLLKPDVVSTFDPIGGYRHPDHIHIHKATTLAFERANDPAFYPEAGAPFAPRALYYQTISHRFLKVAVFLLRLFGKDPRHFGKNGDIDLVSLTEVEFPVHARIDIRPVWTRKEQASACHSSQGGRQMQGGVRGWVNRLFGGYETFMRAWPPVQPGEHVVTDLFEGIG